MSDLIDLKFITPKQSQAEKIKCPKCLMVHRAFLFIRPCFCVCNDCGTVFVTKAFLTAVDAGKMVGVERPVTRCVCYECGKVGPKPAMKAHARVCGGGAVVCEEPDQD